MEARGGEERAAARKEQRGERSGLGIQVEEGREGEREGETGNTSVSGSILGLAAWVERRHREGKGAILTAIQKQAFLLCEQFYRFFFLSV